MRSSREGAKITQILGSILAVSLVACGAPADVGTWYGGAPDSASCEGRGGVQAGSICRFETDLRHNDFFFNHFIEQYTARLTPSVHDTAMLAVTGAQIGDRIEWTATGAWAEEADGCVTQRDLSGSIGGILALHEGQPQGLMLLEEGGSVQLLGSSAQIPIQGSGTIWMGLNTPSDSKQCWQVWPTRFVHVHCEEIDSRSTVACP